VNCSQCNQANVPGARYCRLCGSALESRLGARALTHELLERTFAMASSLLPAWLLRRALGSRMIVSSALGVVCVVSITIGIGVRQGWWVETRKPQRVEVTDPEKMRFADEVTGETVLWYYRSPSGDYELYDRPGFHRTGAALAEADTTDERRSITEYFRAEKAQLDEQERLRQDAVLEQARQRELADKQAREEQARRERQRVEVTDPNKIRFADEATGENVLWYYRSPGGDYELYDRPGFHPTGAALDAADTEDERRSITEYFKAEKARLDDQERLRQEALAEQARQRELADKQAREEHAHREHEAFLNRYLANRSARSKPALTGIAVVAAHAASPRIERDLATTLATTLRTEGIAVIEDLFTDAFVADGLFDKLSAGSGQAAEQLDLGTYTDYVLLCKIDVSFSEHPTLQNVQSAAVKANVTLIKAGTGHVVTDISLSEAGPGFSKADARNAAYERVAGAIGEQLELKAVLEGDKP